MSDVTDVELVAPPDNSSHNDLQGSDDITFMHEPRDILVLSPGNEDIYDLRESRNNPAAMIPSVATEVPSLPNSSSLPKTGSGTDDELNVNPPSPSLRQDLAVWAATTFVSRDAVNRLLAILRSHGHPE